MSAAPSTHRKESSQLGDTDIEIRFTVTTSGAVVTPLAMAPEVKSIVKGTTGVVVTMNDSWNKFVNSNAHIVPSAYSKARAVKLEPSVIDVSNVTTPAITFLATTGDGTAIDLTTGDTVYMTLTLSYIDDGS